MISKRLLEISKYIENGSVVADIGCDHALLSIFLVEEGICNHVIASDINEGPINNAKRNISYKSLTKAVDARLGAGLQTLEVGEADTCVISGMGGSLIVDICKQSLDIFLGFERIICQANNSEHQLRAFMVSNGYLIKNESVVNDNDIIYEVICFDKGQKEYTETEIKYGPFLLQDKDPLFLKKLTNKRDKLVNILNQIPKSNQERVSHFESEISELNTLIKVG